MRFKRTARPHILHLELTAMIDVIFLLIIFFMTTARFVQQSRANVELPQEQGQAERETETPPLVINVLDEGLSPYIVGDGRAMTLELVLDLVDREIVRLQREDGLGADALEITIRADRRGMSRALNELAGKLRERGVTRWRLAVEQSTGGP